MRAADTVDDAEAMRAAMLVRQPSLKSIKTKVEREPVVAEERGQGGSTITLGGSARYRANCGRAIGRGVNFDEDGNTPRSGGDGEMLGSIDSGTPTFSGISCSKISLIPWRGPSRIRSRERLLGLRITRTSIIPNSRTCCPSYTDNLLRIWRRRRAT